MLSVRALAHPLIYSLQLLISAVGYGRGIVVHCYSKKTFTNLLLNISVKIIRSL